MNADWSKPRKIFHFDNTHLQRDKQSEVQFITCKMAVIQQSVTSFLRGEENHLAKILPLNRALQSVLIRNDYSRVHQTLIKQFYTAHKSLLDEASKQPNALLYLLAYFIDKKETYRILFTILNNYLSPYTQNQRLSIEEQAYDILCKEIINSPHFERIGQQLMALVEIYRTTNDQNQLVQIEHQLRIVAQLGIYSYFDQQFLQRSKMFFVKSSQKICRNEQIFSRIDQSLRRQTLLNKILSPSQNSVSYLQKEYIEEYFPFLIEYMDYLIQENKFQRLQILWKFTAKLGQEEKNLFQSRLKQIVKDVRLFLSEGQSVSEILLFRDKLVYIINHCFASSRALLNMLYNTIEEVLLANESIYNQALADKIFKDDRKQSDQLIQQLFKLIPNKEKFVKQLEIRFFRWIIYSSVQNVYYQEGIIHMIKKECGSALCKKLDRMVNDVWREGRMLYYYDQSGMFKCRLLSLNDWPKFTFRNIVLPDRMKEIIEQFQTQFKKHPEHAYKELTWVNELGTVEMSINGVNSFFSEVEAALIFILDKSFRPMNAEQLSEIVQGKSEQIAQILTLLYQNQILEYNEHNKTYEINDANIKSYATLKKQKSSIEESKDIEIKDNSIIIDAVIVKILKRKKTIHKTEISQMVLQQIGKMKPKIQEINISIERLEKRQFLEIDKSKGILHYRQ